MAISKVVVVDGNNLIVRIDRGVAGRGVTDVEPIEIDGSLYLVFTFSDGTTETIGPVGTIQYIGQAPIVVTGSTISLSTVPVNLGGTGQTTANAGFNALAPTQTGNAGKYLKTDGTNSAWDLLDISTADITGVLPIANGGTNASTASGARTNLGLGTIATQDASAVAITGGSITGITDLAVADGGTGASTAAGAMVNLLPSYTGNANKRLGLDGTATGLEWVTDGGGTVTSVDVSGGTTGLSFTGGPVTTSGTITLSGTLDVDNGGTGATTAAGARTNLNAADQALTLTAGTGLSGGGDLSANRTFSITNTGVTAASYGSASNTLTATVNAQGQLTALAATPIAISNTQVSGLGTMSTQNSNAVTITGGSITGITDLAIADGGTGASNAADARSNLGLGTAAVLNAGVALGVATLDAGGTVPLSQIPASIQGGVSYQGAWNASTNTPTLVSSVGSKGYYYVVSVSGNTNLNGVTDWLVGDWAIYNGTAWEKIDNTDQVASVNGYTGVVVLTNTDVGAPPTSLTISAGTGLSGGGNLTTNRTLSIANTAVSAGSYGTASAVPSFTVNGQGQLTAASDVTIAITNTQVSGLGTMSTQNANSVAITGGSITGITDLAIADGGTGASTANGALSNLGGIGTITSTDGSIVVTPSGTTVDLAVSAASPASTLLTQVRNTTGATLTKGTVVYISGATGQIATVSKAIATGDATSAQTLGMITSDLANNSNGYVTVFGLLENMDTSAYTDGAQLYLSGTTAGAVTATKPSAPTHLVYVAVVEYAHPTQGKLLVKVQNGYELDEIHDVSIVTPVTGQTLVYNATTDLWVNNTVSLTAGVNGTLPIANGGTGQTTANAAFNALAPSQTGNSGKYLTTDGTDTSWASNPLGTVTSVAATVPSFLSIAGSPITTSGTLAISLSGTALPTTSGGTGLTSVGTNLILYGASSSAFTSNPNFTYDGTTFIAPTHQATGSAAFKTNSSSGQYFHFDNASGNNFMGLSATNVLSFYVGGVNPATFTASGISVSNSLFFSAGALFGAGNVGFSYRSSDSTLYLQTPTGGFNITDNALNTKVSINSTAFTTYYDAVINGVTVGRGAGAVATNTAVGASALSASPDVGNTAVGNSALAGATSGGAYNTAVGYVALSAAVTGSHNVGVGVSALNANTSGSSNVAVGRSALNSNTFASNNTAVGYQAGYNNQTGTYLTLVGYQAGFSNTVNSPQTSIGYQAGYFQTGTVVALGYRAAYGASGTSTGNFNTAIGDLALQANTTASNNTAVGYQAGYNNTTGISNTNFGYQAGYLNQTGQYNAFFGYQAGYTSAAGASVNAFNTALGTQSGYGLTTGVKNTLVGYFAGGNITIGSSNTVVGGYNGNQGGLDIRTANNYIVLSDGDGNWRQGHNNVGTNIVKWQYAGTFPTSYTTIISGFSSNGYAVKIYAYGQENGDNNCSFGEWIAVYSSLNNTWNLQLVKQAIYGNSFGTVQLQFSGDNLQIQNGGGAAIGNWALSIKSFFGAV